METVETSVDELSDYFSLIDGQLRYRLGREELDKLVERSESLLQSISTREVPATSAVARLRERLQLTRTELLTIVLAAAVELDVGIRSLVAEVTGQPGLPLTVEAVRRVIYGEHPSALAFEELSAGSKLRRWGVFEVAGEHFGFEQTRLSRMVLRYLVGTSRVPSRMLIAGDLCIDEATRRGLTRAVHASRSVVLVAGQPFLGKRTAVASTVSAELGLVVAAFDCAAHAGVGQANARALREFLLDCRVHDLVPLLANMSSDFVVAEFDLVLSLFEDTILVTSGCRRPVVKWDRPVVVVEMGKPTTAQLATLWHQKLGHGTEEDAQYLAERYPLAPALIHHAAEAAKARANGRELEPEDIYAGIRTVLDDRLGQYARRVTVTQTWDDLVLPQDQLDTIAELMARVRGRSKVYEQWGFAAKVGKGLGVSALFSGPPGTGKTMVAALIARDLGLELYQVDVAKIVSKFIGETEKNLAALFDAAEAGHAVLLFDEADALFGKRTDVKSSNDRYANLETNYLLQRLETFTGICLLTSNHESNIDPAFQRRMSLHLRFEVPDADERAKLWRAVLPAAAPVAAGVDFGSLARRYAMSGGYIKNAALRAAFLAADEGGAITAAHLERAARVEYEGMGKLAA